MMIFKKLKVSFRKLVLSILKITSMNIVIRHHYSGTPFLLNSYHHKGYWYYGKKREFESMMMFADIIKSGMSVLEIGGHIGYLTVYFSCLVGETGKVIVFEPGKNNLSFLKENVRKSLYQNITIEEKAAGSENRIMTFYLDPLTGQNNTLVKDFKGFDENRKISAQPHSEYIPDEVSVIRLDDYLLNKDQPDFIKIDIEGYEWECLQGLMETIEKKHPVIMIEIQANAEKILDCLFLQHYRVYNDKMTVITDYQLYEKCRTPNMFFFPEKSVI